LPGIRFSKSRSHQSSDGCGFTFYAGSLNAFQRPPEYQGMKSGERSFRCYLNISFEALSISSITAS
jgi:hypothetical protein